MRLFSYCIRIDDGAAPNPYWGLCTLSICKPVIRRTAKAGDWVLAVGSKNVVGQDYSGKLVYAMKVTKVMTFKEYDSFCNEMLPEKLPDVSNVDYRRKVGDCIYDYTNGRRGKQRLGVHTPKNREKDLRGKNVLLSEHFYYFGKKAVRLPHEFSLLLRQGQGHQSFKNESIKLAFLEWLMSTYKPNHLYGKPQVELRFNDIELGNDCSKIRCIEADEDESCKEDC